MEKIKVNMSPNPLDVQTIHASQNDGEAREWEFELHNNGELIDTSDITEQLVFKAYKGGTEQILPENTSTPTTSPFLGDIKYPQGLLTDQEFTYRQSPTEEDGLAKITDIKGNTLVWNQLVQNGNFSAISPWSINSGGTLAVANNEASVTLTSVPSNVYTPNIKQAMASGFVINHKYLFSFEVYLPHRSYMRVEFGGGGFGQDTDVQLSENTWHRVLMVRTRDTAPTSNYFVLYPPYATGVWSANDVWKIRNVNVFDLTQMGLDISSPSGFTSLFPLSYYAYNQGTLLSFNGNGIKTVGFNQWDEEWESGTIGNDGSKVASVSRIRSKNYIPVLPNTTYYTQINNYSIPSYACLRYAYDADKNPIGVIGSNYSVSFTTPSNCHYILFSPNAQYGTTYNNNICINISDTSKNGTYEPYTESTLSLPISTYFPTGMKSAGTVYDELTPTKATTRIGVVDLGTLDWVGGSWNGHYRYYASVTNIKTPQESYDDGLICSRLTPRRYPITGGSQQNNVIARYSGRVYVATSDYTSASDFKTAMDCVYLHYELSTPTETSFTTASLVTENAEIPLSNEDGILIGKCTEQLSENPGFIDAKIKLSDADGECYSNKIQLHVERSPQ